jgi:hypothetical protein
VTTQGQPVPCPDHAAESMRDCRPCRDAARRTDHESGVANVRISLAQAKADARNRRADMTTYIGEQP